MKKFLVLLVLSFPFIVTAQSSFQKRAKQVLTAVVMKEADSALREWPITVTAFPATRSAGGRHDFFSEGDYWWPDPAHPDGPYIQRDGLTNPENFTAHRKAMIRFSQTMGALASAYLITHNEKYAHQAFVHARAWLIDSATYMHPHMLYAQAIKGRFTGRGIGIIDMIQFMEVSQALLVLEQSASARKEDYLGFRQWFTSYLKWVTTHQYGIDEKNALNNHGTCWTMQVAAFARFTHDQALMDTCVQRFIHKHLPDQMSADGSFPKELARTKPYGYSIFNLDAMTMICQILSTKKQHLWTYTTPHQTSIEKGIRFIYPYILSKENWPYKKDVMYWDEWPVAQPFLLFGAAAYKDDGFYTLWEKLEHAPQVDEVIRNLPVRHPLIWFVP